MSFQSFLNTFLVDDQSDHVLTIRVQPGELLFHRATQLKDSVPFDRQRCLRSPKKDTVLPLHPPHFYHDAQMNEAVT